MAQKTSSGGFVRKSYIAAIKKEISKMHLSRLIVFADVINRYTQLRMNDENSLLRVHAILFIITRGGRLTPSQLASLMLRSRNSISKLIEGLENDGMVRRYHPKKNRRTVYIEATPAGLKSTMATLKEIYALEEEIRSCLDDGELQVLVDLSRKLRLRLIEKLTGLKS
jgi:DNA-binding MarR family transcriptional regulator